MDKKEEIYCAICKIWATVEKVDDEKRWCLLSCGHGDHLGAGRRMSAHQRLMERNEEKTK